MKFVEMRCPNCNADLNIEDGIDSFCCKYCGTRIIIEGQSDEIIKAKRQLKMIDKLGEMQSRSYAQHRVGQELRQKVKAEKREQQAKNNRLAAIIGAFLLIASMIGIFFMDAPEKKETQKLEAIYAEIQTDIANENYDSARIKANQLRWSGSDPDKKEQWDEIREQIIVIIEDLQNEN